MLLKLECPNFQLETIERFNSYAETLCIELDELPTENYLISWMYRNFCNWPLVKESFKLAYRNPAGYPNRCFVFLWHRVNEEIQWAQIEANKRAQDAFLQDLTKLPQGHYASIWGNAHAQKVTPVKGVDGKKGVPKQPATGGAPAKTFAVSKADNATIANLKNHIIQLDKNLKDWKAKAGQNYQAAIGGKPDPKKPQQQAKANAIAPDLNKFTKLPKPIAEMSAAEKKKVLCRFFTNGACSKRKDCQFGHYGPRDKSKKYIALFPEDARKGKTKQKAKPQAKPKAKSGAKQQQKKGKQQQQKKNKLPPNSKIPKEEEDLCFASYR